MLIAHQTQHSADIRHVIKAVHFSVEISYDDDDDDDDDDNDDISLLLKTIDDKRKCRKKEWLSISIGDPIAVTNLLRMGVA